MRGKFLTSSLVISWLYYSRLPFSLSTTKHQQHQLSKRNRPGKPTARICWQRSGCARRHDCSSVDSSTYMTGLPYHSFFGVSLFNTWKQISCALGSCLILVITLLGVAAVLNVTMVATIRTLHRISRLHWALTLVVPSRLALVAVPLSFTFLLFRYKDF